MEFRYKDLIELFSEPYNSESLNDSVVLDNVHFDSRKILKSGIFIALEGESENGAIYCSDALSNGASAIVAGLSSKKLIENQNIVSVPIFYVDDPLKAFAELAIFARNKYQGHVTAVIGSAGKTTTKNFLSSAANVSETNVTYASFNNETGVPLTVCNFDIQVDRAIVELGESHFGDIDYVTKIAKPNILVVTNVGSAHLEFLGDKVGVAKTLNEAVVLMDVESFIVVPEDVEHADVLLKNNKAQLIVIKQVDTLPETYDENEFYIYDVLTNKDLTHQAKFSFRGKETVCDIPLLGKHFVLNAALAVCACVIAGDDIEVAAKLISNTESEGHRMRVAQKGSITLFDDCYNANETSMKACIGALSMYAEKNDLKSVIIMGKMAELGAASPGSHKEVIEYAFNAGINEIICIGEDMKNGLMISSQKERVIYYDTVSECVEELDKYIKENTVVAVKASRGPNPARPLLLDVVESIETLMV